MEKTATAVQTAKGILLIAIGSNEYLEMAKNLAMSIKHLEPEMPICLAHNYNYIDKSLFDFEVKVPNESWNTKGKIEYIKVKTWMYDFSPFQETIFLDVDMVWLFSKKPSELFNQCIGLDWTMSNTGLAGYSIWCDINDIRKIYPDVMMWNYHSECVYFNKSEKTKTYFDTVKDMYLNPPVKGTKFGGASIADELAFQLASLKLNEFPHKENWLPIFWFARDKKTTHLQPYKLSEIYFAYSVGGNKLPTTIKSNFSTISNYHSKMSKLGKPYKIRDKKSFIPERRSL
jgi:hypothetical protein